MIHLSSQYPTTYFLYGAGISLLSEASPLLSRPRKGSGRGLRGLGRGLPHHPRNGVPRCPSSEEWFGARPPPPLHKTPWRCTGRSAFPLSPPRSVVASPSAWQGREKAIGWRGDGARARFASISGRRRWRRGGPKPPRKSLCGRRFLLKKTHVRHTSSTHSLKAGRAKGLLPRQRPLDPRGAEGELTLSASVLGMVAVGGGQGCCYFLWLRMRWGGGREPKRGGFFTYEFSTLTL